MEINLIEYFEKTVQIYPNKLAISDSQSMLNFEELKNKAKSLSRVIEQRTENKINQPIGIYLPKCNDSLVSFIATLYSGNCYAPLDIKNPINRINSILEVLKPCCIITSNKYVDQLDKGSIKCPIIYIDDLKSDDGVDMMHNYLQCIDMDPAYIIHTSGSTGTPKGVVISHRSIFNYINWAIKTFNITDNEIIGNQAPFVFDNSTLDIYLMIFTGATLHLIPEQYYAFPGKLIDYLNENQINFVFWVPTVLINIANLKLLDKKKVSTLRKILFAGEVMPTKQLNYWIKNTDVTVTFANLYGPTEITVDCTYFIINRFFRDDQVLPIGVPCRNSDVIILNSDNKKCERGEQGELCVRGSSLALGYWNNFEKTESVFVQNPLNSFYPDKLYRTGDIVFMNELDEIIFVGRKDFQIKHLGYRIELGEIEHKVLCTFESLKVCCIYDQKSNEIVLFYESQNEISKIDFRVKLSLVLSNYMIPTKFIRIDRIPLTTSGKMDRALLNQLI